MDQEMEMPDRQQPDAGPSAKRTRYKLLPLLLAVAAVCLVLLIVRGIQSRLHAESLLVRATEENAVLRVNVVHPKLGAPTEELVLPGNMEPFTDAPIYARTNGYVRRWYVDIGAHVKAGQLLAEIETPEVDQQLSQARAQLATSQSKIYGRTLAKSAQNRLCCAAGNRRKARRHGVKERHHGSCAGQRQTPGRNAIVPEDLRTVCRCDYRAQRGYRRSDQRGQQRHG
jgi:hypothetical protein